MSKHATTATAPGILPTGHTGFTREWDGEAWVGPALATPEAPAIHAEKSISAMLRRAPFWCATIGIAMGLALTVIGVVGERQVALLLIGGFLATGGPILALLLGVRRRIGLHGDALRLATVVGVIAGVIALGIALVLERWVGRLFDVQEGKPNETALLLAGPIEEGAKLSVAVLLLVLGVSLVRTPRLGTWTVLVSAGVFGAIEGAIYAANLGGQRSYEPAVTLRSALPSLTEDEASAFSELMLAIPRVWTELGHPIWTTGAAVIIWLAARAKGRSAIGAGLLAFLGAAALHSFNDGVLPRLPGLLPALTSILFIAASYVLWFRPQVSRLVPPEALAEVPERWTPPLPRS